ncbi:hypothetical protein L6452_16648 [Arctium lappa]|uniref:Uncharacterized protein n=1 Tax=Arctium lappa TaxID=4217 RepID=A0ACB9C1I9_ARCLA|nr:hypothetical protein L6452_16648 [Arctium lappa]
MTRIVTHVICFLLSIMCFTNCLGALKSFAEFPRLQSSLKLGLSLVSHSSLLCLMFAPIRDLDILELE